MSDNTEFNPLCFDTQICFSLYSASNAMIRAYRPELQSLDLTYLQYMVMMILWEQDGISISALGLKLHLDSGTLTPLLKRLEAKKLILRKVSEKDERSKCLYLTRNGTSLKQKALSIPEAILCKTALPYEQLLNMKKLCDQMLDTLSGNSA